MPNSHPLIPKTINPLSLFSPNQQPYLATSLLLPQDNPLISLSLSFGCNHHPTSFPLAQDECPPPLFPAWFFSLPLHYHSTPAPSSLPFPSPLVAPTTTTLPSNHRPPPPSSPLQPPTAPLSPSAPTATRHHLSASSPCTATHHLLPLPQPPATTLIIGQKHTNTACHPPPATSSSISLLLLPTIYTTTIFEPRKHSATFMTMTVVRGVIAAWRGHNHSEEKMWAAAEEQQQPCPRQHTTCMHGCFDPGNSAPKSGFLDDLP